VAKEAFPTVNPAMLKDPAFLNTHGAAFFETLREIQNRAWLTYGFLGGIPRDPFYGGIPCCDFPFGVEGENAVSHGLQQ